jgi:hypothetical protein
VRLPLGIYLRVAGREEGVAVVIDVAHLARNVFVEVLADYGSGGKPVPDSRVHGVSRTEDRAIAV